MIHTNSVEAIVGMDKVTRASTIVTAYVAHGELTDRQACRLVGSRDMNYVRPRITELVRDGILVQIRTERDNITGKKVRVCRIRH